MAYKPQITYNTKLSLDENLNAMINWLNFLLREMSVGRVHQNRTDTREIRQHQMVQDETLALTDEAAIELFEAQMAQEEINTAQDEALIELYEMMEGAYL